jgi:uncharacterized protein
MVDGRFGHPAPSAQPEDRVAVSSLLTLIDDIASVLDDVAVMTKVATKKTAGVLGDDLALNAEQVAGVHADRELPVVWAVAKGSARNKLILVPAALAISFVAPWAIVPLLMIGGAFLCFEGFEKVLHKFIDSPEEQAKHHAEHVAHLTDPTVDPAIVEKDKVKGAVRTDFILSAEIVVISLGTVATESIGRQLAVLAGISVIMTIGVYGLVAGIVKLDDLGLSLNKRGAFARAIGRTILLGAPYLMKGLAIAGTLAMFLVGGGILVHGIPGAERLLQKVEHAAGGLPTIGGFLEAVTPSLVNGLAGALAGGLVFGAVMLVKRILSRRERVPVSGD